MDQRIRMETQQQPLHIFRAYFVSDIPYNTEHTKANVIKHRSETMQRYVIEIK